MRGNLRNALTEKLFGVSSAVGPELPSEPLVQTTALTKAPPHRPAPGWQGEPHPTRGGHSSSSWDVTGTKGSDKGGQVGKGPAAIVGTKRSAESVAEEVAKFLKNLNA